MKTFILKVAAFLVLMTAIQSGSPAPSTIVENYKNTLQQDAEVFLFGSSVLGAYALEDRDPRAITALLAEKARLRVQEISGGAFHLELFRSFLNYYVQNRDHPRNPLFIFEINVRSFSPEWDCRPEYQFALERYLLNNHVSRWASKFCKPISIFKGQLFPHTITQDEFLHTPVYKGPTPMGVVADYNWSFRPETGAAEGIRKAFLFHYLYPLAENHRKLVALKDIIQISKRHQVPVLFYLTPIDYQAGEHYLPGEFTAITDTNIALIKQVMQRLGADYLDLSKTLGSECFNYQYCPVEHLKEAGRRFVAEQLCRGIVAHSVPAPKDHYY